ncbi:hypothetical protein HYX16_04875 [Candidatus Woesearchaeota archaeon]|nr:hypothetical protein [Candidatus Woesearchaeota archaeon]
MTKVRLYDPHPGFAGAAVHLPEHLKKLADSLDGKITSLEEAFRTIEKVAADVLPNNGKVEIVEKYNYIAFSFSDYTRATHFFKLISYEELDPAEKAAKLERIKKKEKEEERKQKEETEKSVRKKLNNYKKPKSIDDLPAFTGWTPSFTLEYFGFKLEYSIDLIKIGREVDLEKEVSKVKYKGKGHFQVGFQVSSKGIKKVTEEEREYGRQHAGSKGLFEQKRPEIQKAFDDLTQKGINFVGYRTYRGWPAVWDNVEFYSKPEKEGDKNR